jgi:hypothetical protein
VKLDEKARSLHLPDKDENIKLVRPACSSYIFKGKRRSGLEKHLEILSTLNRINRLETNARMFDRRSKKIPKFKFHLKKGTKLTAIEQVQYKFFQKLRKNKGRPSNLQRTLTKQNIKITRATVNNLDPVVYPSIKEMLAAAANTCLVKKDASKKDKEHANCEYRKFFAGFFEEHRYLTFRQFVKFNRGYVASKARHRAKLRRHNQYDSGNCCNKTCYASDMSQSILHMLFECPVAMSLLSSAIARIDDEFVAESNQRIHFDDLWPDNNHPRELRMYWLVMGYIPSNVPLVAEKFREFEKHHFYAQEIEVLNFVLKVTVRLHKDIVRARKLQNSTFATQRRQEAERILREEQSNPYSDAEQEEEESDDEEDSAESVEASEYIQDSLESSSEEEYNEDKV